MKKMKLVPAQPYGKELQKEIFGEIHEFNTRDQVKETIIIDKISDVLRLDILDELKMKIFSSFISKYIDTKDDYYNKKKDLNNKSTLIGSMETTINLRDYTKDCEEILSNDVRQYRELSLERGLLGRLEAFRRTPGPTSLYKRRV